MNLTNEQIKMLAQQERDMDAGIINFVKDQLGNRIAVSDYVMQELGLDRGQTVSYPILIKITEMKMAEVQSLIAIEKAKTMTIDEESKG